MARAPRPTTSVRQGEPRGKVVKTAVTPHWFGENNRFWYRNDLPDGEGEFVAVDLWQANAKRHSNTRCWPTSVK